MPSCPADNQWVEARIDRILTQYRESPNLLFLIRNFLRQAELVAQSICSLPSYFEIDNAVGDQLTLIGKRLGWPRCHCVCTVQPVFGFDCDDRPFSNIVGFCEPDSTWENCDSQGFADLCINDDEMYRKFLKVRRYQMMSLFDIANLTDALRTFFGDQATVMDSGNGRIVLAPGRDLTSPELNLIQLYPRVLPIAPGINIRFHFGPLQVFGFGEGWGGFCEPYADSLPLVTEGGKILMTENNEPLMTGPITKDAEWMCEIDVKPYDCL